jgi:hypothetical protein
MFQILKKFEDYAGLKLNKTKTEAMWLGKWRHRDDKPLNLKWVNEVHSLGIYFSYNTDYVTQKNFTDKAKTFKRILDLWAQRDLSLLGKIAILKSLAFSTITYQCCSLQPPEKFIEEINSIAFKFLWNGKPEKVKRKTIIADYSKGGLRMVDIATFNIAQKAMWVKRLCQEGTASWKAYPTYLLSKILGKNTFKSNLNVKNNIHNIPQFYWSIITSWIKLTNIENEEKTPLSIRRQILWLNQSIKINKKEVKWNNWINHNILTIHDILDENGKFLSANELNRLYDLKCDILQYTALKDAIPRVWRETVKTMKVQRDTISSLEMPYITINNIPTPISILGNKNIYWQLIEKQQIAPITKENWYNELNLDEKSWKKIFELIPLIRDTKIRTFQYKIIMKLIPCNLYLFKIGRADSFLCQWCNLTDNITHYFCTCKHSMNYWLSFQNWWNNMTNETIVITKDKALMGTIKDTKVSERLNACLLLSRWYIYTEKLNQQIPSLYKFLCHLKYKLKIEKIIHLRHNTLHRFNNMWEEIEEHLG